MANYNPNSFKYVLQDESVSKACREVHVSFKMGKGTYRTFVFVPKADKQVPNSYYIDEAKKEIDQQIKSGQLIKNAKLLDKKHPYLLRNVLITTACVAFVGGTAAALSYLFLNRGGNPTPTPTPTIDKYVVSFDTDGGSFVPSQQVEKNKTASKPTTDPEKTDYTFGGWYRGGKLFDFNNTPITENTTITAKWAGGPKSVFTVEYDSKGGSHIDSQSVKDGDTILSAPTAKREGYADTSTWYIKDSSPETEFKFGPAGTGTAVTSNMSLYCKWNESSFDAVFKPNGGTWSDGKTEDKTANTKLGVVPTFTEEPTRGDYPFLGWKCSSTETVGLIPMKAGGETYTAQWGEIPSYEVVFDGDVFVDHKGDLTVDKNASYTCDLYIVDGHTADHEIDKENLAVYVGMNKLVEGSDFEIVEKDIEIEEKQTRVLELTIKQGCIDNTLFISAKSVERSTVGEFYTKPDGADGVIITGLKLRTGQELGKVTEIAIPDTYEGKEVTGIDAVPEEQNDDYRDGDGLLTGCSSLRKLTIPFVGLSKVANIDTSDMEQENHLFGALFGHNAFENAEVTTYQDYYYDWTGEEDGIHVLKDFAIPNTLKEVKITQYNDVSYSGSTSKKSIPLGAFSNCAYITDIEIPDNSGVSFDRLAFSGCKALRTFKYTAPETVSMEVGRDAFNGCGVLASFDFKKVSTIKKNAFANCTGMLAVYLPESITKIEVGAFSGYAGLVKCQPEENPTTWEEGWVDQITPVIYGLPSEEAKPITSKAIPGSDFVCSCLITQTKATGEKWAYIVQYLGPYDETKTTITIPDVLEFDEVAGQIPVKYIGSQAFMDYNLTEHITVNCSELVSVGPEAFKKCYALEDINFSLCTKLNTIGCNAFEHCNALEHVNGLANANVESIGNYAFYNCPCLVGDSNGNKLNLPKVTSVGVSAFEFDPEVYPDIEEPALTSVTLFQDTSTTATKGVTFGDYAFRNCSKLTEVKYTAVADKKGEYTIPKYCFYGTAIKDIKIPKCTTIVDTAAFAYCQSAETILFDGTNESSDNNKVRVIGDSAFLRCSHLNYVNGAEVPTETYLPLTLESIGRAAFQDCFHLSGITCKGAKFKEIPDSMCYGDSRLNHFYYTGTATYTKIGQFAFAQDQAFTYIGNTNNDNKLPFTLREIGDRAFINCVSLGRHSSDPVRQHPFLHIQYDTQTQPDTFKMGEQVFYGCYGYLNTTNDYDFNGLTIDAGWVNKLKEGGTGVEGWNWILKPKSGAGYNWYQYDQSAEGWSTPLNINLNL